MDFRDMMKCASGVCCAAVVMCASGAWGMDEVSKKQYFRPLQTFVSIGLSFPIAIEGAEDWRKAFATIKEDMEQLCSEHFLDEIGVAYSAIYAVCNSFSALENFCSVFRKDSEFQTSVLLFLRLMIKVATDPKVYGKDKALEKDLKRIVDGRDHSGGVLIFSKDEQIFARMRAAMEKVVGRWY